MAAVLRGQASLAHTVQNPLPEQPACSVRLEFIRQHMVQVLQRDLIFLVFLPASLRPSPLREMNLVTAHLCLPLASRVVNELSVCSADDRLGAWPCAVRRARLGTAKEDERVLVEFSPREATADVPGRCNMTPKGRGGDFWMSLLGLQLPQRTHACRLPTGETGASEDMYVVTGTFPCACSQTIWVAPRGPNRGINLKAASPKTLSRLLFAESQVQPHLLLVPWWRLIHGGPRMS